MTPDRADSVRSEAGGKVNVFVSYSRSDLERAQTIIKALEERGLRCTIDTRDLPYGEKWQGELKDFIRAADSVLFLVSPRSIASQWCKWELAQVASQSKRLVPAVIENVPPEELPPEISEVHLFPLTDDLDINERAEALAKVLLSDRAWVKEHTRLADRAHKWFASQRARDHLLTGRALAEAEQWMARRPAAAPAPSQEQLDFIVASQLAAKRRSRLLVVGASVAAGIFAAVAGVAVWQGLVAVEKEREAVAERDRALNAQARALASLSNQLRVQSDPTKGTAVAIEALTLARATRNEATVAEAEEVLLGNYARLRESLYIAVNDGSLEDVRFGPDDKQLVVSGEKAAHVFDNTSGKLLFSLSGHSGRINAAVFSPDGSLLLTASADKTARLWNGQNGQWLNFAANHSDSVWSAAFSRDGARFLTTSADGAIRVFDTKSRKLIATLTAKRGKENDVPVRAVFTPDGTQVAATYAESASFRFWNIASRKIVWEAVMQKRAGDIDPGVQIYGLAIDDKGETLAVAGGEGRIGVMGGQAGRLQIWNIKTRERKFDLKGHADNIVNVAISPDGTRIVTASRDSTLRLWDTESGESFELLQGHADHVYGVAFSRDGQEVASASRDGSVIVWDATWGVDTRLPSKLEKSSPSANEQKFDSVSGDGRRAANIDDYETEIWDVIANKVIARVKAIAGVVNSAVLNPDGTRLVTAERNGYAIVWDASTGNELFRLEHDSPINEARFSPDGTKIATAGRDGVARLWNAADGALIYAYRGHGLSVDSIVFSPDGARLLTSGGDGRVRLWSVRSGADILAIVTHRSGQTSGSNAIFSADGKSIIVDTFEDDEQVIVIDIAFAADRLLGEATKVLARCLTPAERLRLSLEPAPPQWCVSGVNGSDPAQWKPKWPYDSQAWRDWLLAATAARAKDAPAPAVPKVQ
jgi:WD40 repeat protein